MVLKTNLTRLALAFLLAFAGIRGGAAASEGRLVAMTELAADSQAVSDGSEALLARWTLHNDTLETRRVLVWHTPLAFISTSTSPAFGPASSTSSMLRGLPAPQATAARTRMTRFSSGLGAGDGPAYATDSRVCGN